MYTRPKALISIPIKKGFSYLREDDFNPQWMVVFSRMFSADRDFEIEVQDWMSTNRQRKMLIHQNWVFCEEKEDALMLFLAFR